MNVEWTDQDEKEADELLNRIQEMAKNPFPDYISDEGAVEAFEMEPVTVRCPMPDWAIHAAMAESPEITVEMTASQPYVGT